MREIKKIIVHCSATKEGQNFNAKDITRWHLERGFKTIGYHYVVTLDGTIQVGRKETSIGAHCSGHNKDSIGVCYIGGLDKNGKPKDTRTKEQKESLLELLTTLKRKYPKAIICNHYDYANKACPSFNARDEYKDI